MIRVAAFYRWIDGAKFDHEYYNSRHMQLVRKLLESRGMLRLESDRYLSSAAPAEGEIIAASHVYFSTLEMAQAAMTAAAAELMADVPKYTNIKPEVRMAVITSHG